MAAQQLAPWSRLKPLGDPACLDKSGYRTIIATPTPWLALLHGDEIADAWGMRASASRRVSSCASH
jgi:hypothetical protein